MSVLIKGMDMPETCSGCDILDSVGYCYLVNDNTGFFTEDKYRTMRHPGCPLIEIPPHNRLIDADAEDLRAELWTYTRYTGIDEAPYEDATKALDGAPSIIEAEE